MVVAAVDAHEVLLLLLAAVGLRAVEAGTAHPERARAWSDVQGRREALLALLRRPLSGEGPGAGVRAAGARCRGPVSLARRGDQADHRGRRPSCGQGASPSRRRWPAPRGASAAGRLGACP